MHIAEGFLPAPQAAAWFAVAAIPVIHGARAVMKEVREHPERRTLLAAAGAFTFVLSAIKLPSVSGSSSHPTGTGLGAVLFRPPVMSFLCTIVLIFQALLLGHGGITTLGANVFSMGIIGPWIGYLTWLGFKKLKANETVGIFFAMALANLSTYCVTSIQLAIAYPDPVSGFAGAMAKFLGIFAFTQIPLSIIEGLIGVLVFRFLRNNADEQLVDLHVLSQQELVTNVR